MKIPEAAKYLNDNRGSLMRQFGYLDGTNDLPENQQWSRIAQGLRNIESAARLGALVFTHAFSMSTIISKMKYSTGVSWGEALANTIASLGRGAGDRFGRGELHDLLLSNIDGHATSMMQHWTARGAETRVDQQHPRHHAALAGVWLRYECLQGRGARHGVP